MRPPKNVILSEIDRKRRSADKATFNAMLTVPFDVHLDELDRALAEVERSWVKR